MTLRNRRVCCAGCTGDRGHEPGRADNAPEQVSLSTAQLRACVLAACAYAFVDSMLTVSFAMTMARLQHSRIECKRDFTIAILPFVLCAAKSTSAHFSCTLACEQKNRDAKERFEREQELRKKLLVCYVC